MAVLTVATVVSPVVLALKVQIFIRQLRERRAALEMDEEVSGIAYFDSASCRVVVAMQWIDLRVMSNAHRIYHYLKLSDHVKLRNIK